MTPAEKQTLSAKHQDWVHLLLLILMISFLMFWLATWFYHHSCWALGSEPPSVRSQTSFGHWGIGVSPSWSLMIWWSWMDVMVKTGSKHDISRALKGFCWKTRVPLAMLFSEGPSYLTHKPCAKTMCTMLSPLTHWNNHPPEMTSYNIT